MTIGETIEWLRGCGHSGTEHGWICGDSYRGYYYCFSVEPAECYVSVQEMIGVLEEAIGETFTGYKGGEFTMDVDTPVFYAHYGNTGPEITRGFLKAVFTDPEFDYTDFC